MNLDTERALGRYLQLSGCKLKTVQEIALDVQCSGLPLSAWEQWFWQNLRAVEKNLIQLTYQNSEKQVA